MRTLYKQYSNSILLFPLSMEARLLLKLDNSVIGQSYLQNFVFFTYFKLNKNSRKCSNVLIFYDDDNVERFFSLDFTIPSSSYIILFRDVSILYALYLLFLYLG